MTKSLVLAQTLMVLGLLGLLEPMRPSGPTPAPAGSVEMTVAPVTSVVLPYQAARLLLTLKNIEKTDVQVLNHLGQGTGGVMWMGRPEIPQREVAGAPIAPTKAYLVKNLPPLARLAEFQRLRLKPRGTRDANVRPGRGWASGEEGHVPGDGQVQASCILH
jgi:hypothetical protein